MLPIFVKLTFESRASQAALYLVALGAIVYIAYSGWRAAPASAREARWLRAAFYGAVAALVAKWGLNFALPATAFLGRRGEGIPIHTYGIMLAIGFIGAVTLSAELARREWRGEEGIRKRGQVLDLAFWVLVSALVGSKLLFIAVNWNDYAGRWGEILSSGDKFFQLISGGVVFYGGLLGAGLASYWYSRVHRIDFLRLSDLALPTVSFGQCIGRLGCFSAGCCWGDIAGASVKTAVHFPGAALAKTIFGQSAGAASIAYETQAADSRWAIESSGQILHHVAPGAVPISQWVAQHGHTLPVHPTQLYESFGQLALFGTFLYLRRFRRFHGQIMALWVMAYAVLRTAVELFRGDVERGTLHGFLNDFMHLPNIAARIPLEAWYNISTSQFISVGMFIGGAVFLYRKARERVPGTQARPQMAAP